MDTNESENGPDSRHAGFCRECNGSGFIQENDEEDQEEKSVCLVCNGTGENSKSKQSSGGVIRVPKMRQRRYRVLLPRRYRGGGRLTPPTVRLPLTMIPSHEDYSPPLPLSHDEAAMRAGPKEPADFDMGPYVPEVGPPATDIELQLHRFPVDEIPEPRLAFGVQGNVRWAFPPSQPEMTLPFPLEFEVTQDKLEAPEPLDLDPLRHVDPTNLDLEYDAWGLDIQFDDPLGPLCIP